MSYGSSSNLIICVFDFEFGGSGLNFGNGAENLHVRSFDELHRARRVVRHGSSKSPFDHP